MNWLDIVLLAILIGVALIGYRMGLIRAAVMAAGAIVAPILAAQLSGPLADRLTDSVPSYSVATVLSYIILGVGAFVAIMLVGAIATKIIKLMLLGLVNTLLGALTGAAAGFLAGGALVLIVTRLAILAPAHPLEALAPIKTRAAVVSALKGSSLVPVYLEMYDVLPANALGLIPGDFKVAVDELKKALNNSDTP